MSLFRDKNVLVTGGTGLIGRQLVDLLVEDGAEVTVACLDDLRLNDEVDYCKADLCNFYTAMNVVSGMDYVFHLAGIKASPKITKERPATMSIPALQINTNILEACKRNDIQNVLFTSSIGAYAEAELLKEENAYLGEPMDMHPGMVKRMAEKQIDAYRMEYGLNYKVVRLANIYGPGDNFDIDNSMFIPSLIAKVCRGDNPVELWGDGTQVRDFLYSRDAACGIIHMMLHAPSCYPVNIGSGCEYSVRHVVDNINQIISFNVCYNTYAPSGVDRRVMDISKARALGWEPETSLYDGLRETWDWYVDHSGESKQRMNYFR